MIDTIFVLLKNYRYDVSYTILVIHEVYSMNYQQHGLFILIIIFILI